MKKMIKTLSVCMSAMLAGKPAFALPLTASAAEITSDGVIDSRDVTQLQIWLSGK